MAELRTTSSNSRVLWLILAVIVIIAITLIAGLAVYFVRDNEKCSTASTTAPPGAPPTEPPTAPPEASQSGCTEFPCLVFQDEFDFLDNRKWEHELTLGGGGNWEFQQYCNNRTNSYVRAGVLYIKPTLTEERYGEDFVTSGTMDIHGNHPPNQCTGGAWYGCLKVGSADNILNPIQSARLRTSTSFHTRYCRVETRARMPAGDWIWPAIWMLPRYEQYGTWPASGEIDIFEGRGNADLRDEQGRQRGNTYGGSTLHWGPFFEGNRYARTSEGYSGDLADSFHNYTVEWNKNRIVFEFDGEEVLRVEPPAGGFWELGTYDEDFPGIVSPWRHGDFMAPFDTEFYLVLNVAVGGVAVGPAGYFSDAWTNGGYAKPWNNSSPFAARDFQNAKNLWYPTWKPDENNGESAAMAVDYIRVYKMSPDDME